jgi:hypothetical protein
MFSKLIKLFIKLDFRDKDNSGKKKLIGILIGYLFSSTAISFNYFITFDEISFAILSFTVNIFLLMFVVLTDYNNLFFSKNSIDVIKNLPVEQKDLFLAKYFSAILFVFVIAVTSILPQIIYFYFYEYSILRTLVFLVLNLSFIIFATTLIIILYTILLKYISGKSNYLIYIFQIFFVGFVMYSSSLASKSNFIDRNTLLGNNTVKYFPQTFFAKSINNPAEAAICIAITLLIIYLLYSFMKGNYYQLADIVNALEPKQRKKRDFAIIKKWNIFIEKFILKTNLEKASYGLIKNHLKNSKTLRVKYLPIALIPVGFCLVGVLSGAKNFLIMNFSNSDVFFSNPKYQILSPSISMMLLLCIRLLDSNTKIADENTGDMNWFYSILPIKSREKFLLGIQKFLYINFVLPIIIIIGVILSFKIAPATLSLNLFYFLSSIIFINSVYNIIDKKYPFTSEYTKYNSATRLLEILLTMLFGIVIFIAQVFIFQNIIFIVIVSLVLLTISFLLNR